MEEAFLAPHQKPLLATDPSPKNLCSFIRWWKLNKEKAVFDQPYKHMALFLNYMRGPKVEDWADDRQKTMDQDVTNGYPETSEHHWTTFQTTFQNTYTNLGEKVFADRSIQNLKMEKGDIDTYIATFMKLLGQAGYQPNDQEALTLFKRGLPAPLNVRIINNTTPIPSTLEGWKMAAREQQLQYL